MVGVNEGGSRVYFNSEQALLIAKAWVEQSEMGASQKLRHMWESIRVICRER